MVLVAVARLILPDHDDHLAQAGVGGQMPVVDGNLRGRHIRHFAGVDLGQVLRIADDRLFLEIADHAVCYARGEQVEKEVEVVKHQLRGRDQHPFQPRRLGDLDKGHQVHAFVIGLFDQLADPALIIADVAQGLEMLQQSANHARHGRHGFQHNGAMAIAVGKEPVGKKPHEFDKAQRGAVAEILRRVVRCGGRVCRWVNGGGHHAISLLRPLYG